MKVAITHTRYTFVGGVEKYIFFMVRHLLDAGHEVHYFCHFWEDGADPRIHFHRIPNPFKPLRALKVWSFDRWSEKAVARGDFDLVHGFTKTSRQDIYTDGSGCLRDYEEYSLGANAASPLKRGLRRVGLHRRVVEGIERARFTPGNFHRVVCMSELVRDQILRRYPLDPDKVLTLYNGIDVEHFSPANVELSRALLRDEHGLEPDAFVVLLVANDYRRKGLATVIEALAQVKAAGGLASDRPLRLAVVGKERAARVREFEQRAADRGVAHELRIFGPQRDIARWHAAADLFVLPSHFDIFGMVVLEAFATGIPAAVCTRAGAAEIVDDSNGVTFDDPDDAGAIAAFIQALDADPARARKMGEAARRTAETYSWPAHMERLLALYEEVRDEKRAAAEVR